MIDETRDEVTADQEVEAMVNYNQSREYSVGTWRHVQIAIGAEPDGVPGIETAKAVFFWQHKQGFDVDESRGFRVDSGAVDGKVGPKTLTHIGAKPREDGSDRFFLPNLVAKYDDRVYGIDVSDYQGRPNFAYVYNAGARFCFIKLSEGRTWQSKDAAHNWLLAIDSGLTVAGYHLARLIDKGVESSVEGALDNFFDMLSNVYMKVDVAIGDRVADAAQRESNMLDLEYKQVEFHVDQYGTKASLAWCERFVAGYRRRMGYDCGLYLSARTARLFGRNHGDLPSLVTWWADYGKLDPLPKYWPNMNYRQFTSSGRVPGVKGKCDLNYSKD